MTDEHHTAEADGSGLSFAAFVLSLAHTTAVHLGDVPDPVSGHPSAPNLAAAFQMIEILGLLELKTRGNLSAEERQLLEQVLYELRLRFVEIRNTTGAAQGGPHGQESERGSQRSEDTSSRSEEGRVPPSGSRTPAGIIIP